MKIFFVIRTIHTVFEKYFLKSIIFRPKSKSVFTIFGTKIQIFEKLAKIYKHHFWRENSNETYLVILKTFE